MIGDDQPIVALVHRDRAGVAKLARSASVKPDDQDYAAVGCEAVDPVALGIDNVDVSGVCSDVDVGGPNEVDQRVSVAEIADQGECVVVDRDHVVGVSRVTQRDEKSSVRMCRHADRPFSNRPRSQERPGRVEARNVIVVQIGNVRRPVRYNGNPRR